jgi:hypothetical protein
MKLSENSLAVPQELPQLPIRGVCSRWDLVLASYACMGVRPVFGLLGVMLLVLFGWVGWITLQAGEVSAGLLFMAVPVFTLLWVLLIQPSRGLSAYVGNRVKEGEGTVHLLVNGLAIETLAARRSFAWENFINWREGSFCFVLLLPRGRFEFIPKRFFASQQDEEAFAELLRARIKLRHSGVGSKGAGEGADDDSSLPDLHDVDLRLVLGSALVCRCCCCCYCWWRARGHCDAFSMARAHRSGIPVFSVSAQGVH